MLFSYLIGTVFKLYGPVTDYWTYNINRHISYDYVITNGKECHIALGITLSDDERSMSWNNTPIKDGKGENVMVMNSNDQWVSGIIPNNYVFAYGPLHPGDMTKVAYLTQPKNPNFSVTFDLKIEAEGGEISTETTTVSCSVDACQCVEKRQR